MDVFEKDSAIQNEQKTVQDAPTTPTRRASYLAPTRSSLARSHPELLEKSPKRPRTEPRGKFLREQLLGKRGRDSQDDHPENIIENGVTAEGSGSKNLEDTKIAAQTSKITDVEAAGEDSNAQNRIPLSNTQPRNTPTRLKRRHNETDSISQPIVPELVDEAHSRSMNPQKNRSEEQELPPTPVQLGLDPVPVRPRGLASSSSGGSRSGSGRHRRRTRLGEFAITSSPLKPKRQVDSLYNEPQQSELSQDGQEALESDVEEEDELQPSTPPTTEHPSALSKAMQEKQYQLAELQAELEKLRADLDQLGKMSDNLEKQVNPEFDDMKLDSLIIDDYSISSSTIQPPTKAHLQPFSPGNVQISHTTSTQTLQGKKNIVHSVTVKAPPPWPSNTLQLSFDAMIDLRDTCIDSITYSQFGNASKSGPLLSWIEDRLKDPLHMYDLNSLIWGCGNYFEECVKRATIIRKFDKKYHMNFVSKMNTKGDNSFPSKTLELLQYMNTSIFKIPAASIPNEEGHDTRQRNFLLSYKFSINWTGQVTPVIELSCSGFNAKTSKSLKELFHRLLCKDGVVDAFNGVWDVVQQSNGHADEIPDEPKIQPGRKKKKV